MGVNRISLGVQSFQDELLQKIGRHHSSFDVYRCINDLRECDLKNISNLKVEEEGYDVFFHFAWARNNWRTKE